MPKQRLAMTEAEKVRSVVADGSAASSQRLDKWLWYARVVKSRTLAASLVQNGKVRINRERIEKPSQSVRPGDVITVAVHRKVRVLRVLTPGARRGPAKEAMELYEELSPQPRQDGAAPGRAANIGFEAGAGRPTKRDRRAIDRLKDV